MWPRYSTWAILKWTPSARKMGSSLRVFEFWRFSFFQYINTSLLRESQASWCVAGNMGSNPMEGLNFLHAMGHFAWHSASQWTAKHALLFLPLEMDILRWQIFLSEHEHWSSFFGAFGVGTQGSTCPLMHWQWLYLLHSLQTFRLTKLFLNYLETNLNRFKQDSILLFLFCYIRR